MAKDVSPQTFHSDNPVFDATVAILSSLGRVPTAEQARGVHKILLELAAAEPGGFLRNGQPLSINVPPPEPKPKPKPKGKRSPDSYPI